MSIWTEIGQLFSRVTSEAFSAVVEAVRTIFEGDAQTRKRVSFSIAIIALSAKMAKADGIVTPSEVQAFREIFDIPPDEFENVARLYNLAKTDVAGYDSYARQIHSLFPSDSDENREVLRDVLDGLFHIAKADSVIHENELLFLEDIAVEFGFDRIAFERMKARHVSGQACDPFALIGAEPYWSLDDIKKQYRKRVAESHPDRLIARGVPAEFIVIANDRLAALNNAWESIQKMYEGGSKRRRDSPRTGDSGLERAEVN